MTGDLPAFSVAGRETILQVRRSPQARKMRLSVDPRDGGVRLVLPKRAALSRALDWVEGQRGWVEQALAALPDKRDIEPGASIPFEGGELRLEWSAEGQRMPRREDDRLIVGGDAELVRGRVLRWLKARALERLEAETRSFAAKAGVTVGRVGVGDPRTRWGSCSSRGDIRYSWRLILAPPHVLRATAAHEVAHRLHMDHGPHFHAAVRELLGEDPRPAIAWLRANGAGLYWTG